MRNELLDARNRYKTAEEGQRKTNLELKNEIELRNLSEKALAQSEIHYRTLFEESTVSLWEEDWSDVKAHLQKLPPEATNDFNKYFQQHPEEKENCFNKMRLKSVNRATLDLFHIESKETLVDNAKEILASDYLDWIVERFISIYHTGHYDGEISIKDLSGRSLHILVRSSIVSGYETTWKMVYTSIYDITDKVAMEREKERVEKQIQHTRQIQSIASLAGGISQQFNNSLAVIFGHLDMLVRNTQADNSLKRHIHSIKKASNHMSSLTDQLLAYARGGKYQPKDFSVNDLIREIIHDRKEKKECAVTISTKLDPGVFLVSSDITQIKMVLEAAIANALEATGENGEVTISTQKIVVLEDGVETDLGLKAGGYALITIQDQGVGMDEDTKQRIFEPFFSTKFIGRGLGMAAAFGIVKNHDGIISVHSEQNKGTQVMIYLPGTDGPKR